MVQPPANAVASSTGLVDCWNQMGVHGDQSCPHLARYTHCRNCPVFSGAARELLDGPLREDYVAEWTRHVAQPKQLEELDTQSALLFRLGAEWLALPTARLQEIAELRQIHSLPHRRSGAVLGLVNVRGELLVCLSLAQVLGVERTAAPRREGGRGALSVVQPRLLVLHREGSRVAAPVDEVHGIHRYHPDDLREVPSTVARATATYTRAMLPWREQQVGVLDDQLLFYTLNRSLS
jgi:chemotaxis-related protein WspD